MQPPAGPAYSVAAGSHYGNSAQLPASMSPPAQQQAHNSNSSSGSNSMVNHIGALLSPSSESTTALASQVIMSSGSPLQNGPINLMSPLSKQQQMSGLLSMTSSMSLQQKAPVNVYTNMEQATHLPNTTSLSQSSTNSSFLDEAIFSGTLIILCQCGIIAWCFIFHSAQ